jgi:hypothetical protein
LQKEKAMTYRAVLLALTLVVPASLFAEEPAAGASPEGPRIRLTAPSVSGGRLIGTVVSLDEATLTLQRQGGEGTLLVPLRAITTLEVSRHRSRKGKGAAIGALVGLGSAVAIGLAAGDDCTGSAQGDDLSSRLDRSLCFGAAETTLLSAILTVPAGALLGLVTAPGEKWEASTPDRLRIAVAPVRGGGVRAAVSVRF